jgi:hypothetical protein
MDPASGTLTHVQVVPLVNPSFLAVDSDQRFLYSVHADLDEVKYCGAAYLVYLGVHGFSRVGSPAWPCNRRPHAVRRSLRSMGKGC